MTAETGKFHDTQFSHATDMARARAVLRDEAPDAPVILFRPDALAGQLARFQRGFPGNVSYAVKANPSEPVLAHLARSGLTAFDVASVEEMRAVRAVLPDARLHYHNPVRSRTEIMQARAMGVASWSVDRLSELDKLGTLDPQTDIAVRLTLKRAGGAYDFGSKFGASPELAATLLTEVRQRGGRASMTFHPGTQCTDPSAWSDYIAAVARISRETGITLNALNVGGGFPSAVASPPETLRNIFNAIAETTRQEFGADAPTLWCEPGRAMVADAMWLALRVKARSETALTLNDGLYGSLGEWRDMPVPSCLHVIGPNGRKRHGRAAEFTVFGPTCDSLDRVPGPWCLPSDIAEDDHILIEGAGAYAQALSTRFNGYGLKHMIDLFKPLSEAGQSRQSG